jgi:hypothetical protein
MSFLPSLALGLFSVTMAAPSGLTPPPAAPTPQARQTTRAALDRATRRLDPVTRPARLEHENVGAQGRKNALVDTIRQVEEPALVQPPLSGPWGF